MTGAGKRRQYAPPPTGTRLIDGVGNSHTVWPEGSSMRYGAADAASIRFGIRRFSCWLES